MPQGNPKKIRSLARVLTISAGPAIASLIFGALATGKILWFPALIGVALIAGLSTWQMTSENKIRATTDLLEKRAEEAERELERAAVFDAGIQPVTQWYGKIHQGDENYEMLRGQILDKLTETAGELVCPDALCAFYRLDTGQEELVLEAPSGNPGALPRTYSKNDGNGGSYMLFLATSGQGGFKFVEDIDRAHFDGADRVRLVNGYRTALFLPVTAGPTPQGLIVIQARKTGDIPAPLPGEILDGNYRKFYAIASLASLPRVRNQTNGQLPRQVGDNSTQQGEPAILPHNE
ncbi:hypothetical protein [Streptomyces sp. NBC_00696]|uniref:hypothetical protein n=1 Tax=Streptomyces sp. NBC_00696 TaxID=2903672 RepID=UPI002E32C539|nr:hypothetical protein [Streptomyces sp. NBC_00696]